MVNGVMAYRVQFLKNLAATIFEDPHDKAIQFCHPQSLLHVVQKSYGCCRIFFAIA